MKRYKKDGRVLLKERNKQKKQNQKTTTTNNNQRPPQPTKKSLLYYFIVFLPSFIPVVTTVRLIFDYLSMLTQFSSNKFFCFPLPVKGQGYSTVHYSWISFPGRWHTQALVLYTPSIGESLNCSVYQSVWMWWLLIWSLNFNKYFHKCRLEYLNLSH